jgi:hypothetical protein
LLADAALPHEFSERFALRGGQSRGQVVRWVHGPGQHGALHSGAILKIDFDP